MGPFQEMPSIYCVISDLFIEIDASWATLVLSNQIRVIDRDMFVCAIAQNILTMPPLPGVNGGRGARR